MANVIVRAGFEERIWLISDSYPKRPLKSSPWRVRRRREPTKASGYFRIKMCSNNPISLILEPDRVPLAVILLDTSVNTVCSCEHSDPRVTVFESLSEEVLFAQPCFIGEKYSNLSGSSIGSCLWWSCLPALCPWGPYPSFVRTFQSNPDESGFTFRISIEILQ